MPIKQKQFARFIGNLCIWYVRTPCRFCLSPYHAQADCPLHPKLSATKWWRLQRIGLYGYLWMETRRRYFAARGLDVFICHYCGRMLQRKKTTLDHLYAQAHHPELRFVLENLIEACAKCNGNKADRSHDDFPHTCYTELPVLEHETI